MWPAYITHFHAGEPTMEKIEAPDMEHMQALTLYAYRDVWFAGKPYGPDMGNVVVNYYRGKWLYYADPSPYGMDHLHLFSHAHGWGFSGNRIYQFNGQSWNLWLELNAYKTVTPCDVKSQANVWAVASYAGTNPRGNVVLHYDGALWREVFAPGEDKYVNDVAMYDNENGWAGGAEKIGNSYVGRFWQCKAGVWSERLCPTEESVSDVEVVSPTEAWALTAKKILHYRTDTGITPASFGRIKSLFARNQEPDSRPPETSRFTPSPPPPATTRPLIEADVNAAKAPAAAAD